VLVVRSSRPELVLSVRGLLELLLTPYYRGASARKSLKTSFRPQHFRTRCIATKWPSPTPSYEPHNNHFNFSFHITSLRYLCYCTRFAVHNPQEKFVSFHLLTNKTNKLYPNNNTKRTVQSWCAWMIHSSSSGSPSPLPTMIPPYNWHHCSNKMPPSNCWGGRRLYSLKPTISWMSSSWMMIYSGELEDKFIEDNDPLSQQDFLSAWPFVRLDDRMPMRLPMWRWLSHDCFWSVCNPCMPPWCLKACSRPHDQWHKHNNNNNNPDPQWSLKNFWKIVATGKVQW
jgi:hypothetical protein